MVEEEQASSSEEGDFSYDGSDPIPNKPLISKKTRKSKLIRSNLTRGWVWGLSIKSLRDNAHQNYARLQVSKAEVKMIENQVTRVREWHSHALSQI